MLWQFHRQLIRCHCCLLLISKEAMHQCTKEHWYTAYLVLNSSNSRYIGVQVRIKDEEAKSMDKLVASVLTMLHEWQEKKEHPIPQEHIHRHSFDIKSSKVFTYVVITAVVCLVSLVGNYFLWQSKQQYKDDALKFRIIRVWRGCSPKEILWLNDVFDIHRNAAIIKKSKSIQMIIMWDWKQKQIV